LINILASDLLETARTRAEIPEFTSTTNVTDTQAVEDLKGTLRRYSSIVGMAGGAALLMSSATITTQADLDLVSLPTDFQSLGTVYWQKDATTRVPLTRLGRDDLGDTTSREWDETYYPPAYAIKGNTLQLRPVPAGEYTLKVEHTAPLTVAGTSDYVSLVPGADEWVVLDLVQKWKTRLKEDTSDIKMERAMVEADLRTQIKRIDGFKRTKPRNTRRGG
jgi:hypothetical protein